MSDLDQQLRAYFDVLADEAEGNVISRGGRPEMDLQDNREKVTQRALLKPSQTPPDDLTVLDLQQRPSESAVPSRRRRWSGAAVAVAATILVVVGFVAGGSADDVVVGSVSSPGAVEFPERHLWSRVPDDQAGFRADGGGWMSSVVVGGPGFVAVGSALDPPTGADADSVAAVWTSTDGVSWSRTPHDEAVFTSGRISSVIVGGPGLVAVGHGPSDDASNAAVWTSRDGVTWSRVPHDEAVFGGRSHVQMSGVAVGGPGLVAVGSDEDGAAVWTSADGITWSRVPSSDSLSRYPGNYMEAVTAGGPGLVAVGASDRDNYAAIPTVWTSPDGINWSVVPGDPAFSGDSGGYPQISDVTTGGPGLVAVGWIEGNAAVWTSPDGVAWSRVPHDEAIFGGSWAGMADVIDLGSELIAVGTSDGQAVVWASRDGVTWSRVPHDDALFGAPISEESLHQAANHGVVLGMAAVAAVPSGLVAVGMADPTPNSLPVDAVVWIAERKN